MASWAGLCPGNRESAEIRKGSQTTYGSAYLRTSLVQCAGAATRKLDSVFQVRFQRPAPRRGDKRAIVAVAHLMLVILFCMLKQRLVFRGAKSAPKQRRRERRECFRNNRPVVGNARVVQERSSEPSLPRVLRGRCRGTCRACPGSASGWAVTGFGHWRVAANWDACRLNGRLDCSLAASSGERMVRAGVNLIG